MSKIRSLSTRIALSYLGLTLFLFVVTTFSFYLIVRQVVLSAAESNLHRQGVILSRWFENHQNIRNDLASRPVVRVAGRILNGDYILVDAAGIIQSSSRPRLFPAGARITDVLRMPRLSKGKIQEREFTMQNKDYLIVRLSRGQAAGGGALYMLAPLRSLDELRRNLLWLAARDSLLVLASALLLAWFFGRRIAGPLQELRRKAEQIAGRDFDVRVDFKTGDEVEELGRAVNSMAMQLGDFDRSQRRFFQNISHELRTPLMSIRGYAEGLRDGVFAGTEVDSGLDVIIKESGRMQTLVEDILFLCRLTSPREVYQQAGVDLLPLLQEVVTTLDGLAEDRGVTLQLDGASVATPGDEEKLRRLWINILGNALRYARSRVTVSLTVEPTGIEVRCRDDGPGFHEKDLPHLFSEFSKGQGGQTGLGLAIAREIVHGHRGEISARNHPDGGAEVVVRLPAWPGDQAT